MTKVYHKSQCDSWGTPTPLYQKLHQEFQFSLDAAADSWSAKCPDYLTEGMDALDLVWWGRVWLNCPYSKTKQFLAKTVDSVQNQDCELVVALVAARTDTHWFWHAAQHACEIRFLKGRLKFEQYQALTNPLELFGPVAINTETGVIIQSKDSAPFPSAILVFNKAKQKQRVRWWDWQKDQYTEYQYGVEEGSAAPTPQEIKEVIIQTQQKLQELIKETKMSKEKEMAWLSAKAKVDQQLKEASQWPGFIEKQNEIAEYLETHSNSTLKEAYWEVMGGWSGLPAGHLALLVF